MRLSDFEFWAFVVITVVLLIAWAFVVARASGLIGSGTRRRP